MMGHEAWRTVIAMDLIPLSFWANAGQFCGLGHECSIGMSLPNSQT